MRHIISILIGVLITVCCTNSKQTPLFIIGTIHETTTAINSDSLYILFEKLKPDVILCELEENHFTPDYQYNLEKYGDLLSTNENISTHCYQQAHGIALRPYDIDGRNEYYRNNRYFERQNEMFGDIARLYQKNKLSKKSTAEWKKYINSVKMFDILKNHTLAEINSPLYTAYSEAKNQITFNTFISITQRDLPQHITTAQMLFDYWNLRNDVMAQNIETICRAFEGKTVVVLCGQQHKKALSDRLYNKTASNIKLMNYPD